MASIRPVFRLPRFPPLVALLVAPLVAQVVVPNGSIDWTNPAGWSTGHVPGGTESPQISTGTITVTGDVSVSSFDLFGGTLTGPGTLTLTDSGSRWKGGEMTGSGTTSVGIGADLTLSGADSKNLYHGSSSSSGRTLDNSGTITWTGDGFILLGDGAQIVNRSRAVFEAQNDSIIGYIGFGDSGSFINNGAFRKVDSTDNTTLALAFANNGVVEARSGTISFASSVTGSGEFRAAEDAKNLFFGNQNFGSGTSFTGAGLNRITAGTTHFGGAISSTNLEFAGGSATGSATFSGDVAWTGGDWIGAGTFTFVGGNLTISSDVGKQLYHGSSSSGGREISIGGNLIWDDPGAILGGDGAGFSVQSGGSFEIRNDAGYSYIGFGNIPFLNNAGTLRKTGGRGTTTFSSVAFNNTGSVLVQSGTLEITGENARFGNQGSLDVSSGASFVQRSGGGASSGSFSVASGGSLSFTGGTPTFEGGASFTGKGIADIAGAAATALGAVSVGGRKDTGTLRLSLGSLGGSGMVTVNAGSTFQWTGGDLKGSGTLRIASGGTLTIDGEGSKSLYHGDSGSGGHTISNFGTTVWRGAGNIYGGDGATIVNEVGGLFEIRNNTSLAYVGLGDGLTFVNAGTLSKIAGNGTTSFNQVFNNSGVVEVSSGELALAGGGESSGTFRATGSGIVNFTGGYTIDGGSFLGSNGARISSTLTINGTTNIGTSDELPPATLVAPTGVSALLSASETGLLTLASGGVIDGSGTLTVNFGSSLVWSDGAMRGSGITAIASGGELVLSGAAGKTLYHGDSTSGGRTLSNGGAIRWTGAGTLLGGDGARIDNLPGGVFDVQVDSELGYLGIGNTLTFTNEGLFLKSAGKGAFTLSAGVFNNPGAVSVQSGTLALNAGGSSVGGSFNVSEGAKLSFGSNYSFDGATLAGAGRTTIDNHTLSFNGATTTLTGILDLPRGSALTGSGVLEVKGALNWTGGEMTGPGTTRIASGGQLLLTGADTRTLYHGSSSSGGRILENNGVIALSDSGRLQLSDGATVQNNLGATFDFRGDGVLGYGGSGNVGTFTNAGLLEKSGGSDTSTVSGISFVNQSTGRVWAQTGTLTFLGPLTSNGGTFEAAADATIRFDAAGTRTFGAGTNFAGNGAKLITTGTTAFVGAFTAQNLSFSGGALTGPAALQGTMRWTGGDWTGSDTFSVSNGSVLTLDGANGKYLYHGSSSSGGRTLSNSGVMVWQGAGQILLGDGAQIVNQPNAIVDIRGDSSVVYAGSGNHGSITNNGLFAKTGGTGTTTISEPFTQTATGTVAVSSGTLVFASSFTNNGGLIVVHGGNLSLGSTLDLGTGTLAGTGTITASLVVAGGQVSPGNSPGMLTIAGDLSLLSTSRTLIELGGTTQGTGYDFLNVTGTATLGGTLAVTFTNNFAATVSSADTFTILAASLRTGTFQNVPNSGTRLTTFDGAGSFQVNFTSNTVTLSNFVAVPEPSTYALMGIGAVVVIGASLRRRKR